MKILKLFSIAVFLIFSSAITVAQDQNDHSTAFVKKLVMEEYTGTWCGNCPRGSVGMSRLVEEFGDRVICIAIHTGTGEPMQISTYPSVLGNSGIPACELNRRGKLDPYSGSGVRGIHHYGLDLEAQKILDEEADAIVKLSAEWNDAYDWDVRFDVTTIFRTSQDNAHYRLAFILLEDGMTGGGRSWEQVNYYSAEYENSLCDRYTDEDMRQWVEAPEYVGDMVYNHVPVNTYGIKDGIAESISSPIIAGEEQHYSNIITTINQKVIQDKSKLSAVVLLIDTDTREIVNAEIAEINPYRTTNGISTVTSTKPLQDDAVYNLNGQKVNGTPQHGIYIKNGQKRIF